ncbi:MAG: 50S ribosomal protein L21 [Deltaproteobacteria bacterium]|jgi:large subunit ribosomal protein L21|nr:50S ribosomal protein L21 [Deltaproteobacteria bacterium]
MYAIIKSGGRQYKVAQGKTIRVNRLPVEVGSEISLDQVLLVADEESIWCGQPHVSDFNVKAEVCKHGRGKKILVFKKKRRKGYHKAQGHRQDYTALKILAIENSSGKVQIEKGPVGDSAEASAES